MESFDYPQLMLNCFLCLLCPTKINNPRWSNPFFTSLLLSLWGLAVLVSGRPWQDVLCRGCLREQALPVATTLTPCVALLILLDSSASFCLAAAPAVLCISLPTACPLRWWLVHLLSLPVLWRGTGPWPGWGQLRSGPSLTFQSCSPPNTRFLRKVLGKGLTRQERGVSAEHICFQEPWGVKQK